MSGKPAIKPVPTGPPPPPPVTPGERAKHYSRSESLPADAQLSFNPLSSNKKPSKVHKLTTFSNIQQVIIILYMYLL